jgi:hypothetical protein
MGRLSTCFLNDLSYLLDAVATRRILPPLLAAGLELSSVEKSFPDAPMMARDRAFISSSPLVYAYPIVTTHRKSIAFQSRNNVSL